MQRRGGRIAGAVVVCLSMMGIVLLAQSSGAGAQGDPGIGAVAATPARPAAAQAVTVTAEIDAADSPSLVYRVGFGAEVTVAMVDDGTGGDAAAGDDTWTALIPGQAAGSLIRYRVADAPAVAPAAADGRDYFGVVVTDGAVATAMPLVEWFIPEADYDSMFDDTTEIVTVDGSVLSIDGVVYDNISIGIRGNNFDRTTWDKQDLEVSMPAGVELPAGIAPYALDAFLLGAERGFSFGRENGAWTVFEDAGFPVVNAEHVHVRRNGDFYGVFRFTEALNTTWLDENALDGDFYEARDAAFLTPTGFLKVQPDDDNLDPVVALSEALNELRSDTRDAYVYRNLDIPQAVNFLAASRLTGHLDSGPHGYALHEDVNGSGLWELFPWDLTNTFGVPVGGFCTGDELDLSCAENSIFEALVEIPEIEEMVNRRIRTLLDGPMAEGVLVDEFTAYEPRVSTAERNADTAAWPIALDGGYLTIGAFGTEVDARRNGFDALAAVPGAQPATPGIVINEILYAPAGGGVEFVELHNPTASAVDISGWTLEGVGLTFAQGTVISSGGFLVVTSDVSDFQASYPTTNNVVLVEMTGTLTDAGETLAIENVDGATIDTVAFSAAAPWPTGATGTGRSIELIAPALDNSAAASWQLSIAATGSPGAESGEEPPPAELCFGVPVTVDLELGDVPTSGNDVILGTDAADTINGLGGNDLICAGAGDDVINAGSGNDQVAAGDGDDFVAGGDGVDRLFGQDGNDTLNGQDGRDKLAGGAGDDVLNGGADRDRLDGNRGRDTLNGGTGRDPLFGSSGNDIINGDEGNDRIRGGGGNDTINGNGGSDFIDGTIGADTINGNGGDDRIVGSADVRELNGGSGSDSCSGARAAVTKNCEA